jgi:hypothetical protein
VQCSSPVSSCNGNVGPAPVYTEASIFYEDETYLLKCKFSASGNIIQWSLDMCVCIHACMHISVRLCMCMYMCVYAFFF